MPFPAPGPPRTYSTETLEGEKVGVSKGPEVRRGEGAGGAIVLDIVLVVDGRLEGSFERDAKSRRVY